MSEHPLGDINGDNTKVSTIKEPSIVDQILELDDFLSGDVRRAEKTARFCLKPDLEASIDNLHAELATLVDENGRPAEGEQSMGGTERTAEIVALELHAVQTEMAEAFRSVRFRAMPDTDWVAYKEKYRKEMENFEVGKGPMWDELIVKCALAPAFTAAQLADFRTKVGTAVIHDMSLTAWNVNTQSGVSIPKSSISSAVLKRMVRDSN